MQRVKGTCGHFPCKVEMTQVGAGMVTAGVAPACRIQRPVVLRVPGVPDVDPPLAGEELTVAGIAGWHHAIEQVDAARDALDKVLWGSSTHQIPRPVHGKPVGSLLRNGVHHLDWLVVEVEVHFRHVERLGGLCLGRHVTVGKAQERGFVSDDGGADVDAADHGGVAARERRARAALQCRRKWRPISAPAAS